MSPKAFLRLAQVNLALVMVNVVSGGAVRLTDSGLGCPDWPTCAKHHLTPPLALHPAVEFGNRMVVVVLCVGALAAVVFSLRRRPVRRDLVLLSVGLVVGIIGEAVLGGVVVYTKLNPYAVMTHFMVGIALLTVACVLALRAGRAPGRGRAATGALARWTSHAAAGLLLLAVVAGTATTGAGPHAGGPGAKRLPVALADMARLHSGIVLVLAALVLGLLYLLERGPAPETLRSRARLLFAAMVAQGVVGYTQYFTHLPALLVGVHILGATMVWSAMVWYVDGLWERAPEASLAPAGTDVGTRSPAAGPGPDGDAVPETTPGAVPPAERRGVVVPG